MTLTIEEQLRAATGMGVEDFTRVAARAGIPYQVALDALFEWEKSKVLMWSQPGK